MHERQTVAAFDFDGTLIGGDSLLPYLRRVGGNQRFVMALVRNSPRLAAMSFGRRDRDLVKERLLVDLLAGIDQSLARAVALEYAQKLSTRVRPAIRAQLDAHRRLGHGVVIVSASLALYLAPLGRALAVDAVLATELEVDGAGRLTGRMAGGNCRGEEKCARLLDAYAGRDFRLYAYGDSMDDGPLLERADVACLVGRDPLPTLD
jgi:phosphatidylglycerophosphatase C